MEESLFDLAHMVGECLSSANQWVTTAESCTGGLIAKLMTDVPGSSAWFDRGYVTYTNQSKMDMLGVSDATLAEFGAVSEATVMEMAKGALKNSRVNVAVSVSGIAGPGGGTDEKPVGTVWIAWASSSGMLRAKCFHFDGEREHVRHLAAEAALKGILKICQH